MLPRAQGRSFLNSDHVVFQPKVVVYVLFSLVMARRDLRAVPEFQQRLVPGNVMFQPPDQPPLQLLKMLSVRFTGLAEQQTLEARHPLTVIGTHLRRQPMRFSTATGPAVANCRW